MANVFSLPSHKMLRSGCHTANDNTSGLISKLVGLFLRRHYCNSTSPWSEPYGYA